MRARAIVPARQHRSVNTELGWFFGSDYTFPKSRSYCYNRNSATKFGSSFICLFFICLFVRLVVCRFFVCLFFLCVCLFVKFKRHGNVGGDEIVSLSQASEGCLNAVQKRCLLLSDFFWVMLIKLWRTLAKDRDSGVVRLFLARVPIFKQFRQIFVMQV